MKEVAGIMEVREEHIFYLEWTGHSWKEHYVDRHVFRGLSRMVPVPRIDTGMVKVESSG